MKKILVIGGGNYQVPLIRRIAENGYEAFCVDRNEQAPGFRFAAGYACIDVLDRDACLEYAKKNGVSAVMTYGATLPLPTVSYIGEKLGLKALPARTSELSKNKYLIKKALSEAGCNICGAFHAFSSPEEVKGIEIEYPCVIKPCDGSGSKGVSLVMREEEAEAAFRYAFDSARYGEIYCEAFIPGKEYSVEAFVDRDSIYIYGIVKTTFLRKGPHNGDIEYGHRTPSGIGEEAEKRIEEEIRKAIRALGVTMGSVNFDVILSEKDGKPYIIDCGIRIGQNLLASHLIPLSRGVSIIDNTILQALGKNCDAEPKFRKAIATRLLIAEPGILSEIKPMDQLIGTGGIVDVVMRKKVGDTQRVYQDKSDTCGWVLCEGESPDDAEAKAENARRLLLEKYLVIKKG